MSAQFSRFLNNFLRRSVFVSFAIRRPIKSRRFPPIVFPALLWFSSSASTATTTAASSSDKESVKTKRTMTEIIEHSNQLFDENKFQEAYEILKSHPDQDAYEIKWRLARVIYSLSKLPANAKRKDELIRQAFDLSAEAVKSKDDDFAGHKWYSILLDAKSGLDGIKERVSQLENVKKHMLRAVELNPQDATCWYILGEFAFGIAELNWVTKKMVAAIFATPPEATYEEALEYFERAENTNPGFYSMNHYMLGKCFYALKNYEKAKEWLAKAAAAPELNEDDKKAREESSKLLKKL